MKFITFYTPKYKTCAQSLIEDAKNLKLDLIAKELDDFRSWDQATRFKAYFIQQYLKKEQQDLCWIDADARIRKAPTLLQELSSKDYDVAAVYFKGEELLSGTLWMACNSNVDSVIQEWIKMNMDDTRKRRLEQRNLQYTLDSHPEIRVLRLPPEYCFIFDTSKKFHPDVEPIIEQFQQSRKVRKQDNVLNVMNALRIANKEGDRNV